MVIWIAVNLDEGSIMKESASKSTYFTSQEDAMRFLRSKVTPSRIKLDDTNLSEVKWVIDGQGWATDWYLVQWNTTEEDYLYMSNSDKLYRETYELIYAAIAAEVI